jgi:hypothetical protein
MNEKKLDWHLFWTAAAVVIPLAAIIIGCYVNLISKMKDLSLEIEKVRSDLSHEISQVNAEIVKIQTVLILKGIAPKDLFSAQMEEK